MGINDLPPVFQSDCTLTAAARAVPCTLTEGNVACFSPTWYTTIAFRSSSTRLTTSWESFVLSRNPTPNFFSRMACDRFSISSKDLDTGLEQMTVRRRRSSPGEFCPSLLLLRIDSTHGGRKDTFQLPQPRDKLFGLLLDVFVLLRDRQW